MRRFCGSPEDEEGQRERGLRLPVESALSKSLGGDVPVDRARARRAERFYTDPGYEAGYPWRNNLAAPPRGR
jgi:hypothetical protein